MVRKKYSQEDILFNSNLIAFISSIIFIIFIIFINVLTSNIFDLGVEGFEIEFFVFLIQIPIQFLNINISYFHIAQENIKKYNIMVLIQSLGNTILSVIFLLGFGFGLWGLIISIIFSSLGSLTYGLYVLEKRYYLNGKYNLKICIDLIKYGLNFYYSGVLAQLNETGSRLIALTLLAPAQIGYLGQGQVVAQGLNKIPSAMNTILFSRVSNTTNIEAVKLVCLAFRVMAILMLFAGSVLWIFADYLIILLYGDAYRSIGIVVQYLMPAIVLTGICSPLISYLNGSGYAGYIPKMQVMPILLQLTITWTLVEKFGWLGAAASTAIGLFIYNALVVVCFLRITKTRLSNLFPGKADLKYLINKSIKNIAI